MEFVESAVTLTIMGTQSPYAKENNACPSFLLSGETCRLLLDCGSGSHRFFDMQSLADLGIVISHLHRDHYSDLYNYMYSAFVMKNQNKLDKPIQIYLPNAPKNIYEDIKNEKLTFSNTHEIVSGKMYRFGEFELEFLEIVHADEIRSFVTKVKVAAKTIVYTGDFSYISKQKIVNFCKNADILICESSFLSSYGFPAVCNHLTARQAGEIAKEADVKKLILSHFWPEEDKNNYLQEARRVFADVSVAKEKDIYYV